MTEKYAQKQINNDRSRDRVRPEVVVCLILLVSTLAVYWPVNGYDFVNFDDMLYVAENPHVKDGFTLKGVAWALGLGEKGKTYWHPLTWFSHMLDCELYGLNPGMHHRSSLVLHAANALLLFVLLRRMTGSLWPSALVAAVFALHPINVDSVAWIAQRKSVLSTFFLMLTLLVYTRYTEKPGIFVYAAALALYVTGLLAKPTLITLPFVLILLDFWPLGRFGWGDKDRKTPRNNTLFKVSHNANLNILMEKIPFCILSLGMALFSTHYVGTFGEYVPTASISYPLRLSNALVSYVKYIGKMLWPLNLSVYYPFPERISLTQLLFAAVFMAGATAYAVYYFRNKPYLGIGWLWFVGTLIPVAGFIQKGLWPEMADRWAYVPFIGLFVSVAWAGREHVLMHQKRAPWVFAVSLLILVILSFMTHRQVQTWANSITLFEHALKINDRNDVAHNNLGLALSINGNRAAATVHFQKAVAINPYNADARNNFGNAMAEQGRFADAMVQYEAALRIRPDDERLHFNLANLNGILGNLNKAAFHYRKALALNPNDPEIHVNLGNILAKQGQKTEAATHYSKALQMRPNDTLAVRNLDRLK